MSQRLGLDTGSADDDSLIVRTSLCARILLLGIAQHIRHDTKQIVIAYRRGMVALNRNKVRGMSVQRGMCWDSLRIATDKGERVLRGVARGTAADIAAAGARLGASSAVSDWSGAPATISLGGAQTFRDVA